MKRYSLFALVCVLTVVILGSFRVSAAVTGRTYTLDADFDEGVREGVEHDTVHDQLQLAKIDRTLSFIWVPNNEGTVSKISTETGDELGRYWVSMGVGSSPSRTTIDLFGNCWVGLQQRGTVVKIGMYEKGQYIDRNDNGIIETSRDANGDGDITGAEVLPWGQDECVLFEVVLIPGREGTYVPGTYPGPYDLNLWGTAPRGLAVDANNNLWAGTWSSQRYHYIDGETGVILKTVDVSPWGHRAYGAAMDENGVLWSSGSAFNHVLKLDPSTEPLTISRINTIHYVDGLGLDYLGHLFVSGYTSSRLTRINVLTGMLDWTKSGDSGARGVACTSDNNVWIANSINGRTLRYDNNGNLLAIIPGGNVPTGVSVDAAGKVWVCNNGDEYINRIDPTIDTIDFSKRIIGSLGHDAYSDMTGIVSWMETKENGMWTVVFDSEAADTPWGQASWNSSEPEGTSISVKVRSSNNETSWSEWENATNGVPLNVTPNGRYLQIETTLQLGTGDISPILYDLTVHSLQPPAISIQSPENKTYTISHVPLKFTVDQTTSWIGYSLDGQANVTITGNTTLSDLSDGSHHLIVYANDTFGNMGQSTVNFAVDTLLPIVTVVSPENKTYEVDDVPLEFTVSESTSWLGYSLDDQADITITGNTTLKALADGTHSLTVSAKDKAGNTGLSDMVYFTTDTTTPSISIVSLENKTYETTDISIEFTIDEPVSWIAYSLDGQANVTITGNTTLTGLSDGSHSLIVYARDTAGNTGASEPIHFSVETQEAEPFPIWTVPIFVLVAAGAAALLIYFTKVKKKTGEVTKTAMETKEPPESVEELPHDVTEPTEDVKKATKKGKKATKKGKKATKKGKKATKKGKS